MCRSRISYARAPTARAFDVLPCLERDHLPAHRLRDLTPADDAQRDDKNPHPLLNPQRENQNHREEGCRKCRPNADCADDQFVEPTIAPPRGDHSQERAQRDARDHAKQRERERLLRAGQNERLNIAPDRVATPGERIRRREGRHLDLAIHLHQSVSLVRIRARELLAEESKREETQHERGPNRERRIPQRAANQSPRGGGLGFCHLNDRSSPRQRGTPRAAQPIGEIAEPAPQTARDILQARA